MLSAASPIRFTGCRVTSSAPKTWRASWMSTCNCCWTSRDLDDEARCRTMAAHRPEHRRRGGVSAQTPSQSHRPGRDRIPGVPAGKPKLDRVLASARRGKTPAWCATRSPSKSWEELNRLYLFVKSPQARQVWSQSPSDFFQRNQGRSLHLIGHQPTPRIIHNEGWWFTPGRAVTSNAPTKPRASWTCAIKACPERGLPKAISQTEALEWSAILRSCSAWDAYQIHLRRGGPSRATSPNSCC